MTEPPTDAKLQQAPDQGAIGDENFYAAQNGTAARLIPRPTRPNCRLKMKGRTAWNM